MKRIGYISDVHADHYPNPYEAIDKVCNSALFFEVDWLVIAGDLSGIDKAKEYLAYMGGKLHGKKIFFVCGNHELYGFKMHDIHDFAKTQMPDNVFILNRNYHFDIEDPDICIIGTTGWIDGSWASIYGDKKFYKSRLNDFRFIQGYDQNGLEYGQADYRSLKRSLEACNDVKTKIVVTHYLPLMDCIQVQHLGDPINHCYANNWFDIVKENDINYWIYGHDHSKSIITVEGTKFVTNGVGYPSVYGCDVKIHVIEV